MRLTILWNSDFKYDHICVFKVTSPGVQTLYLIHVEHDVAHLVPSKLSKWLQQHLQAATVLDTFDVTT